MRAAASSVSVILAFQCLISFAAPEAFGAGEAAVPRIVEEEGGRAIVLPPAMQKALDKAVPGFKTYRDADFAPTLRGAYHFSGRHSPWGVIGDFNGDSVKDVVLHGYNSEHSIRLALMSSGATFKVVEIGRGLKTPPADEKHNFGGEPETGFLSYMEFLPAGTTFQMPWEEEAFVLKHDGFLDGVFRQASGVLYYEDGEFKQVTLSD